MMALVKRTEPGPFLPETYRMGTYLGIRDRGRLIAMAGERLQLGDAVEISAVCTDPDHQGRGLAASLVGELISRIQQRGARPSCMQQPPTTGPSACTTGSGSWCGPKCRPRSFAGPRVHSGARKAGRNSLCPSRGSAVARQQTCETAQPGSRLPTSRGRRSRSSTVTSRSSTPTRAFERLRLNLWHDDVLLAATRQHA